MPPVINQPVPTGRRGRPGSLRSDPQKEYVAGGLDGALADLYRSLPQYVDAVSRDFGKDIYDRIMLDAQVASCIHALKCGILAQGLQVSPAVEKGEPGYDQAVELAEFGERSLSRLPDLVSVTLYNMLDAIPFGNKVAEQVYRLESDGPDAGLLVLERLKVKPRDTLAFVVDAYMNVIGLLALLPGQASFISGANFAVPTDIPNLLPRRKFAVLTWRKVDEDPRGSSQLRAVYDSWWFKQQTKPEYLKYLAQFASPSLMGSPPELAMQTPQLDAAGNPVMDSDGNPIFVNPEEALLTALLEFRNGTALVVPFGADVKPLEVTGKGEPFQACFDYFNREIAKAILLQTLATEEGQFQARAAARVHQDVMGNLVLYGRHLLEAMLRCEVLTPLIEYNFPPAAKGLCPKVSLGDLEQQDFAAMSAAVAALERAGFLAPSQRRQIDTMLGIPQRTEEEVAQAAELAMAPPMVPAANPTGRPPGQTSTDEEDGADRQQEQAGGAR